MKTGTPKRSYTVEFRQEAVRRVTEVNQGVREVARPGCVREAARKLAACGTAWVAAGKGRGRFESARINV